jgi:bacterioferritin-associated ferredoxin
MFVCLCTGVTSQAVTDLVASGASTSKQVADACGAGLDCGRCRRTVRAIIEAASARTACPLHAAS